MIYHNINNVGIFQLPRVSWTSVITIDNPDNSVLDEGLQQSIVSASYFAKGAIVINSDKCLYVCDSDVPSTTPTGGAEPAYKNWFKIPTIHTPDAWSTYNLCDEIITFGKLNQESNFTIIEDQYATEIKSIYQNDGAINTIPTYTMKIPTIADTERIIHNVYPNLRSADVRIYETSLNIVDGKIQSDDGFISTGVGYVSAVGETEGYDYDRLVYTIPLKITIPDVKLYLNNNTYAPGMNIDIGGNNYYYIVLFNTIENVTGLTTLYLEFYTSAGDRVRDLGDIFLNDEIARYSNMYTVVGAQFPTFASNVTRGIKYNVTVKSVGADYKIIITSNDFQFNGGQGIDLRHPNFLVSGTKSNGTDKIVYNLSSVTTVYADNIYTYTLTLQNYDSTYTTTDVMLCTPVSGQTQIVTDDFMRKTEYAIFENSQSTNPDENFILKTNLFNINNIKQLNGKYANGSSTNTQTNINSDDQAAIVTLRERKQTYNLYKTSLNSDLKTLYGENYTLKDSDRILIDNKENQDPITINDMPLSNNVHQSLYTMPLNPQSHMFYNFLEFFDTIPVGQIIPYMGNFRNNNLDDSKTILPLNMMIQGGNSIYEYMYVCITLSEIKLDRNKDCRQLFSEMGWTEDIKTIPNMADYFIKGGQIGSLNLNDWLVPNLSGIATNAVYQTMNQMAKKGTEFGIPNFGEDWQHSIFFDTKTVSGGRQYYIEVNQNRDDNAKITPFNFSADSQPVEYGGWKDHATKGTDAKVEPKNILTQYLLKIRQMREIFTALDAIQTNTSSAMSYAQKMNIIPNTANK